MSINRKLAEDWGLDEHEILEIEELYEALDALISKWTKEPYSEERAEDIHSLEYRLQELWGFPIDRRYHTWVKLYEFRCQWAGKKYRCQVTGEELTIPDDVKPCDFFSFGKCFVDVGRLNFYCRWGGPIISLNENVENDR